jgi:hypothetical protein
MKIDEVVLDEDHGKYQALEVIWLHRLQLMQLYLDKGKLPEWPINVEVEQGQIFMRELIGFLEEEIFEAFEILERTELVLRKGELSFEDRIKHFYEFNEEIADTLHLWFEVMIYFGIDNYAFNDYYLKLYKEKGLMSPNDVKNTTSLDMAIKYSYAVLYQNDDITLGNLKMGQMDLVTATLAHKIDNEGLSWELFNGGRYLSAKRVRMSESYLFHSIKYLQASKHTLKIKYWRNQDQKPDYDALHHNLMEA